MSPNLVVGNFVDFIVENVKIAKQRLVKENTTRKKYVVPRFNVFSISIC